MTWNFSRLLICIIFILSIISPSAALHPGTDPIPTVSITGSDPIPDVSLKYPYQSSHTSIFTLPSRYPSIHTPSEQGSAIRYFMPREQNLLVSDNYTTVPASLRTIPGAEHQLSGWSGSDLDWIETLQPAGSFIVSKHPGAISPIQITIPSGTIEKGLLLYSKKLIPAINPIVQFKLKGTITQNDALLVAIRDITNPQDHIIGAVKPGLYDGHLQMPLDEFAGKKVAVILGAFHTTPQAQEWIISDFVLTGEEKKDPMIYSLTPIQGTSGETVDISLKGEGFEHGQRLSLIQDGERTIFAEKTIVVSPDRMNATVSIPPDIQSGMYQVRIQQGTRQFDSSITYEIRQPEPVYIDTITPEIIVNTDEVVNLSVTGRNIQPGAWLVLSHPDHGEIRPLNYDTPSPSEIYAALPIRDASPGEWKIIIRNPDGKYSKEAGIIPIIAPGTPRIREISPNSGSNAEETGITTIKVDNFVGHGDIFLSRTGFRDIIATNKDIPSSGVVMCKIPVSGQPTGAWNLTLRNPNGKEHTIINGYTIVGDTIHPYIYSTEWNLIEDAFGNISRPGGVHITDNDTIVMTDLARPRIVFFTSDGCIIQEIDLTEMGTDPIRYPADVAVAESGILYIIDKWGNQVSKYSPDGELLTIWGSSGVKPSEFLYPSGICVTSMEEVFITDTNNHRIQKCNSEGKVLAVWGSQGSQDGQFNYPTGITCSVTGDILVIDMGNTRIQQFNKDGRFIRKWGKRGPENGNFIKPSSIASDSSGYLYVTDMYTHQVQKFTSEGEFMTKWGAVGQGPGEFTSPGGIGVNKSGYVYVLDSMAARLQVFKPTGW